VYHVFLRLIVPKRYNCTSDVYSLAWNSLLSLPLVAWAVVVVYLHLMVRAGRIELGINLLAITGAFLSFVSLLTAWVVVERGYDWVAIVASSLFLLFTYPVAVITPLASIGQMGTLIYTPLYAHEQGASIEPLYGYLIAWASVCFMLAGHGSAESYCPRSE